jgi:hypothetical protein
MTAKHNVGADSRISATPSTIKSTCMLVIGKNAGFRKAILPNQRISLSP